MAYVTGAFPTRMKYYSGGDWQARKKWVAVVHQFDPAGNHIRTDTRLGGVDLIGQQAAGDKAFAHLQDLYDEFTVDGQPDFCDIWIRLFSIEIEDVTYGLFYEQSEDEPENGEERSDWVILEPRDIMFHPPWDSGEYST